MSVTVMCLAIYVSVIADMSTKSYHNCQPSVNHIMCIPVMQYRFTLMTESSSRIAHHTTLSVSYWIDFLLYSVAKKSLAEMRQFYFRAREDVFKDPKGSLSFDTSGLEILHENKFSSKEVHRHIILLTLLLLGQWLLITYEEA